MAFVDTTVYPWVNVTQDMDIQEDWPDIQLFIGGFGDNIDGGIMGRAASGLSVDYYSYVYEPVLYKDAFAVTTLLLRPHSYGNITLRSSDPFAPPIIQHGYFTDRRDVETLIAGNR
jgi:glucose 1-dehydrogenase (FAD, quinone)